MLPILFVPQMLFAGFFVTPDLIPKFLRWARFLCTLTYAVRILLIAEFESCRETSIFCKKVTENIEADPDEELWYWAALIGLFVIFRLFALFVLRRKATKFF
jgi:ABC-2 type transporter